MKVRSNFDPNDDAPIESCTFGPFRLEIARRALFREGESVHMPPRAFDALVLLIRNRPRTLTKVELMSALWPERVVEEASLTQCMAAVRKALGDDADDPQYVVTVTRSGYRFVGVVTDCRPAPGEAPASPIGRADRGESEGASAPASTRAPVFAFGPFRLETEGRRLLRGEHPVQLTPKAFDTLVLLVTHRDRAMKKAELMAALWHDRSVDEGTLTQNVFTLRKALGDDSEPHRYIATVPRHGYRFVGEARDAAFEPVTAVARPRSERRGSWISPAAAVALAVVALATSAPREGPSRVSLAVLPFASESGPEGDYVADGLTEGLINRVAQEPGLRVLARTTAFRYRGGVNDAQRAGRELGVGHVLSGSIRTRGGRAEVESSLVDVATSTPVWHRRFSVGFEELLDIEDAIARDVARRLVSGVAAPEPRSRPVHRVDAETYRLCLEARFFWNKRTPEGLRKSVELYRAAIARDPSHAQAHSGLADAYNVMPEYGDVPESRAYPAASAAARRALALDETLAEAHTSLAFVRFWWDRDWPASERAFRRALELNPGYATAHHWYGNVLLAMGRTEEGLARLREAQEADPLSLIIGTELGAALYLARRSEDSVAQLRHTLELDPAFAMAHFWLGRALWHRNDTEGALAEFRRARELVGTPMSMRAELGFVFARTRRAEAAREQLTELKRREEQDATAYSQAIVYAGLGEADPAFAALDRAYAIRTSDLAFVGTDPVFEGLRADPRFSALLERLRRPRDQPSAGIAP